MNEKIKTQSIMVKNKAKLFSFETLELDETKTKKLFVLRGNGTLSMTKEEVVFKRWFPPKTFFIPVESINRIDIKNAQDLKPRGLPILRIYYREGGQLKVFGVCVGLLDEANTWKSAIANVRAIYA